ncbi:MAG: SPOCS domain-containing protein [Bacillota bacterium]
MKVSKELLRLEEVIGEASTQTIVTQDLLVPSPKPPVVSVIDHVANVTVSKTSIVPNKVLVDGVVELTTIYEGQTPYQTVHVMHHQVAFSGFVEIPGAEPDMVALPTVTIEHVGYEVPAAGDRAQVTIILRVFVKVVRPVQIRIITDVTGVPGLKVVKEALRAEDVLGEATSQVIVQSTLDVPPEKPDIVSIIDHAEELQLTGTVVIPNKVIVKGTITLRTIYEGKTPYQTVHVMHHKIGFEQFVEVPGAQPDMTVYPSVSIEFVAFDLFPNGRQVTARIILKVSVKVVQVRSLQVVTDVTGVAGLKVYKELVRVQEVLGEGKRQTIVRSALDIPDIKPKVAAVLNYQATVTVTRTIVAPNKIIIEGQISLATMYEGVSPYQTVHVVHHTIAFSDFVEVPGAQPDMSALVDVNIEHVSYDVGLGDPIAVQLVLQITARVLRTRQIEVVVEVFLEHVAPCTGRVIADFLNVRPTPSTEHPPIAVLERGQSVTIVGAHHGWLRIQLPDGRHGWVASQFVDQNCLPLG